MKIPPQIVMIYLSKKPEELQQCQEFLADKNFKELSNIGHKFKGNGTTFGFPELTILGSKLEQAAKNSDETEVAQVLQDLNTLVKEKIVK